MCQRSSGLPAAHLAMTSLAAFAAVRLLVARQTPPTASSLPRPPVRLTDHFWSLAPAVQTQNTGFDWYRARHTLRYWLILIVPFGSKAPAWPGVPLQENSSMTVLLLPTPSGSSAHLLPTGVRIVCAGSVHSSYDLMWQAPMVGVMPFF